MYILQELKREANFLEDLHKFTRSLDIYSFAYTYISISIFLNFFYTLIEMLT